MDNFFDIPLQYNATHYHFSAELVTAGYSYKIIVYVKGKIISFEPDEEGYFRAVVSPDDMEADKNIERDLLEAIADQLMLMFKD
ncbi:hypothetical protein QWZ08_01480 [Ferruginibacter paludis]|uniref:hypothetical protein n=1 Tax=Ferruginibacter paludis TaxID=1310417 RepID=UPI0025B407F8|nr:hypothetical protein [Ferruginibacter paludis]MDN3654275.1 hypothetical protein [Ferruginibacter paludis]